MIDLHESPFTELAALLVVAAVIGLLGLLLRQPMVVSFIAAGIVAGPSVLDLVQSTHSVELLAELGIAVLLFLVGLKLDLKLIRTLGPVALATGLGQVLFTSLIGFGIGLAMGMTPVSALYVAVALTFSSTIIIVKLLSDKREVDSLHGRIAIGFLIVQDLAVVVAMIVLSALGVGDGSSSEDSGWWRVLKILLHSLWMLVAIGLFIRFVADSLTRRVARSPELLVTFALAWAALLAALGDHLGFSKELGGLLAGIALASTPYREAIVARLASLRDFLLLFFFIALGLQLDLSLLGAQLGPALVFSLFVLIGNPLIVMAIMGYMGYRKRTGMLAGLTVAQISEFSLIFVAMGISLGHVGNDTLGLVTLVGLVTIALSVYMITYSQRLYLWLEPVLGIFERRIPHREEALEPSDLIHHTHDVVLFGLGRYGMAILQQLREQGMRVLAVDFDPEVVRAGQADGLDVIYGDAADHEFVASLPLSGVGWVVASLPAHRVGLTHEDPARALMEALRQAHFSGKRVLTTHQPVEVDTLLAQGADLVLCPFSDAAERAVTRIVESRGGGINPA